jgi:hypothetical protein
VLAKDAKGTTVWMHLMACLIAGRTINDISLFDVTVIGVGFNLGCSAVPSACFLYYRLRCVAILHRYCCLYWLRVWAGPSAFRIPAGERIVLIFKTFHTSWGAHRACCSMGTGGVFRGLKRPGRVFDHLHLSSAEVNSEWSYTCTPPIRLYGVDNDKFCVDNLMYFSLSKYAVLITYVIV